MNLGGLALKIGIPSAIRNSEKVAAHIRRANRSAIQATGFYLRQQIKNAGQTGITSLGWKPQNPYTLRLRKAHWGKQQSAWAKALGYSKIKTVRGGRRRLAAGSITLGSGDELPMQRLVSTVRYQYRSYPEREVMRIGFLTRNLQRIAERLASGFSIPVTKRSRKFFFAIGLPLRKETTAFVVPARPLIEPVYNREKDKLVIGYRRVFSLKFAGAQNDVHFL